MTAVLEYLCSELLDLAGEICIKKEKMKFITSKHIKLGVSNDDELSKFFNGKSLEKKDKEN